METHVLLLVLCTFAGTGGDFIEVRPPKELGNLVTPLHFGANSELSRPGIFAGTLPCDISGATDTKAATTPHSAANAPTPSLCAGPSAMGQVIGNAGLRGPDAFAAAIRESGIRSLRVPGGDFCYFYLPEGRTATMELARACGHSEYNDDNPGAKQFVTLENLATFAKNHKIALIYQLPMLFHLDQGQSHASIRSVFSTNAKNYDHDRIEAQAKYAAAIVRRLRDLHAPVAAWELGNEEWAHCAGKDYARVAAAIVRQIGQQDAQTPIVAVGMGDKWLVDCIGEFRKQGVLDKIQAFNVHYPFGTWPSPGSPSDRANPLIFAQGDIQSVRWFDSATQQRTALGIAAAGMAVSETMVFKFDGNYWDSYRVIGTHAHALVYAWNWMAFLNDPRCNMAVFHDLETPFFGMMRYDVGYDENMGQFVWLAAAKPEQKLRRFPNQYVLSPTSAANRFLSEFVGCRVGLATMKPNDPNLRGLWGRDSAGQSMLVVVHRASGKRRLVIPGHAIERADCLTADGLGSSLPGQYRMAPLAVDPARRDQVELPPWSVSIVRLLSAK